MLPDAKPVNRKVVMPKIRTGTAVRFVGSIKDTPGQRQFDQLAAWLDDLRARGVDEQVFPNTLCPPTARTRDEWREAFLNGRPDQRVRRSMARRSKGTPEERSKVTGRAKAEKPTLATAIAAAPTSDALTAALTPDVLGLSSIIPPESGRWRANVDPRPRLVQLGTEVSLDARGIKIAGCVVCLEVVVVELDRRSQHTDWAHFCAGKPAGRNKGVGHRQGCREQRLFLASEVHRLPALEEQLGPAVAYVRLGEILEAINNMGDPARVLDVVAAFLRAGGRRSCRRARRGVHGGMGCVERRRPGQQSDARSARGLRESAAAEYRRYQVSLRCYRDRRSHWSK